MAAGLLIGLLIALFQALTTIQEMTLTFVPKIIVIFVSILVMLPFMMTTLVKFSQELFWTDRHSGVNWDKSPACWKNSSRSTFSVFS